MNPRLIYLSVVIALLALAFLLQIKYCFLCDDSKAKPKTYSFARTQLVWWTFIILSIIVTIAISTAKIPTLLTSTLILLGIGSLTTISGRIIDISDDNNFTQNQNAANNNAVANPQPQTLSKDLPSQGFLLDILSDKTGISIHRLQALMFNLLFGFWFMYKCAQHIYGINIHTTQLMINKIIPDLSPNDLILLGLSAGTYIALKTTENKS